MKNFLFKSLPVQITQGLKVLSIIIFFPVIIFLLSYLFFGLDEFVHYHWPIPAYQKGEVVKSSIVCEKIEDSLLQRICFTITENNNFEDGLVLLTKAADYPEEDFPWYYYEEAIKVLAEGANHSRANWCQEYSTLPDGIQIKERYYLCRSFLENPHFCKKIPNGLDVPIDKMRRLCYEDAALVWQDSSLCEKALDQDFCYLRLALSFMKD
ncbi:MAG: hypothetical protein AAB567_00450 [Patescibacteria group bacterium]